MYVYIYVRCAYVCTHAWESQALHTATFKIVETRFVKTRFDGFNGLSCIETRTTRFDSKTRFDGFNG